MAAQPSPRERAVGADGEAIALGALHRRGDEPAAEPSAAELVGYTGVHEHQYTLGHTVEYAVHELGDVSVFLEDEAMFLGVVDDVGHPGKVPAYRL